MPAFAEILEERFRELKLFSNSERAERVNTNPGTYSRLINGHIPLTRKRAEAWAADLHPADPAQANQFAQRLLADTRHVEGQITVPQFFDRIVRAGGAVPAEQIADLFPALVSPPVQNAVLLIEYRDIPRAGPHAKYQSLASDLAAAVVKGLSVGMFMPFKLRPTAEDGTRSKAEKLMEEVRDECRIACRKFLREAEKSAADEKVEIQGSLKLYEPDDDYPETLGTGFQAKTFYLQYDSLDGDHPIRHHRIFQWVATPTRDLLVYRGELMLAPAAIRDSFFPVPHYFEAEIGPRKEIKSLPTLPMDTKDLKALKAAWDGFGLPLDKSLWKSVDA